jgi:hypothetical protein
MSSASRLFGVFLLTCLLAGGALFLSRESVRKTQSPRQMGLRWLREEYRLDEATFARIEALHRNYFAHFGRMCRELDETDRPLLARPRTLAVNSAAVASQLSQEQAICSRCEQAALTHLRQVAGLMPPDQAERFLQEMLPAVQQQRRAHDSKVSSVLRR